MLTALITDLLAGSLQTVTMEPSGAVRPDEPPEGAILSGAFNPLHAGHEGMAVAATRLTGLPVSFELAVVNADKGALALSEIERRARQFIGRSTLVLSRSPLFTEKARLYPGRTFILGYDTAVRLLAPRYYGGDEAMAEALRSVRKVGCHFLVAGRLNAGRFATLDDLHLAEEWADLFTPIPEDLFRLDVSSTALRKEAGQV